MLKAAVVRANYIYSRSLLSSWPCLPPVGFLIFYLGFLRCLPMATSDGLDGCLQRGRSQSDPNILTEPGIDLAHGTGKIGVIFSTLICSIDEFLYFAASLAVQTSLFAWRDVRTLRDNKRICSQHWMWNLTVTLNPGAGNWKRMPPRRLWMAALPTRFAPYEDACSPCGWNGCK